MRRYIKFAAILFPAILFLITSCDKKDESSPLSGYPYKGKSLHPQLDLSLLPDSDLYNLNKKVSKQTAEKLHAKAVSLIDSLKLTGMGISILIPQEGLWKLDTGYRSTDKLKKVDSTSVFYWMNVGKMFTGSVITQLVQEKKLTYDDKLFNRFPEFQYAEQITIEQLLTHTSGIYSFDSDSASGKDKPSYPENELINLAIAHKNLFKPGEYWLFNNTGYLLLGSIAEKIEGKAFADIVADRISGPLNLRSIKVITQGEVPENPAFADYDGEVIKEEYAHGGAASISGNSADMLKFLYFNLTGKLYSKSLISSNLEQLYPMVDKGSFYGKGMMVWDFNEIDNTNHFWIGHYGGLYNYNAVVAYDTETKAFIAVSLNQKISATAVANSLLAELKK